MSTRTWNAAFGVAIVAYVVGGTALMGKAMNATHGVELLLAGAMVLLFLAALTAPGLWAIPLPFVTVLPVGIWGAAECVPGFLDFCGLVWYASIFVAVILGLPVAIVGTWLGHVARARSTTSQSVSQPS